MSYIKSFRLIGCLGILYFILELMNLSGSAFAQTPGRNEKPSVSRSAASRAQIHRHRRVRRKVASTRRTRRYTSRRISNAPGSLKMSVRTNKMVFPEESTMTMMDSASASDAAAIMSTPKPTPKWDAAWQCPPEGDATSPNSPSDAQLNRLKNRVDTANFIRTDLAAISRLPAPAGSTRKKRTGWTQSQRDAIAPYEGTPVSVEGYLAVVDNNAGGRIEREESCNCHVADARFYDFHLWLLAAANDSRDKAVVVEVTPPVRSRHAQWTLPNLTKIARAQQKIRVSGWLVFDQEHPEQIGKTRSTLWEIHPIIKIEYQNPNGSWTELR